MSKVTYSALRSFIGFLRNEATILVPKDPTPATIIWAFGRARTERAAMARVRKSNPSWTSTSGSPQVLHTARVSEFSCRFGQSAISSADLPVRERIHATDQEVV